MLPSLELAESLQMPCGKVPHLWRSLSAFGAARPSPVVIQRESRQIRNSDWLHQHLALCRRIDADSELAALCE